MDVLLTKFIFRVILDSIDVGATEEERAKAYIYAFLAFLCTVLKVHHYLSCLDRITNPYKG